MLEGRKLNMYIDAPEIEVVGGLLDSEASIEATRAELEDNVKDIFHKLDMAKLEVMENAHKTLLD